ncbi:MAG: hypothetical protein ACUVS6_00015 [Anaerolineae bacterium]
MQTEEVGGEPLAGDHHLGMAKVHLGDVSRRIVQGDEDLGASLAAQLADVAPHGGRSAGEVMFGC